MAKSVRPSASTPTCWYHVVSFIFIHCLSDLLSIHPLAWAERTPVEAFSSPCSASSFQLRQRFRQKARLCLYRVPSPLSRNADAFGNPTNAMPFPKVGLMLLAMLSSTFMLVAIMKYDVKAKDPNYPSFQRFWASRWTTVNNSEPRRCFYVHRHRTVSNGPINMNGLSMCKKWLIRCMGSETISGIEEGVEVRPWFIYLKPSFLHSILWLLWNHLHVTTDGTLPFRFFRLTKVRKRLALQFPSL